MSTNLNASHMFDGCVNIKNIYYYGYRNNYNDIVFSYGVNIVKLLTKDGLIIDYDGVSDYRSIGHAAFNYIPNTPDINFYYIRTTNDNFLYPFAIIDGYPNQNAINSYSGILSNWNIVMVEN